MFIKTIIKNFLQSAPIIALSLLLLYGISVATAETTNPISTGASEKTTPTAVVTEPQNVKIDISPSLTISAPMAKHIPYLQSIIDIKTDGSAMIEEKFFLIVTEDTKKIPFTKEISKVIKTSFGDKKIKPEVMKVYHNGSLAPFEIIPEGNINRLNILNTNNGLEPGVHSFSIWYYLPSAIETIGDNDTFFWNVSGSGWTTPISRIVLIVKHPQNILPIGQNILLNDAPDTKTKNVSRSGLTYNFVRKGVLYPTQNLIFVETFPKGSFANSASGAGITILNMDIPTISYLLGLLFVLSYFIISWFTVSKEKRLISDPSQNAEQSGFFSPAGFRIFLKKSLDAKTLLAIIISLANKGLLKIEEKTTGNFMLVRQAVNHKKVPLSKGEKSFFSYLFAKGRLSVDLNEKTGDRLTKCRRTFELPFFMEYDKQFLKINYSYFLFGIGIVVFSILFSAFTSGNPVWIGSTSLFLALSILLATSSLFGIIGVIKKPAHKGKIAKLLILFLFFSLFAGLSIFYIYSMAIDLNTIASVSLGLMITVISVAYHLLKSERKLGKAVRTKSDMYLDYLTLKTPLPESFKTHPQKSMDAFLRSLPFAIASDNEGVYIKRFAPILGGKTQLPWYQGKDKLSAASLTDLLSRLEEQIKRSFSFLNPKLQRFR